MKKTCALLLLLFVISPHISAKTKTKTDHPFFRHVLLGYPGLSQLPFFISSENYASAFLSLTHWINNQVEFSTYRDHLSPTLKKIVEDQIECKLENFTLSPTLEADAPTLEKFIATGDVVTSRYRRNQLSSVWAEKGLTQLLQLINLSLKESDPSPQQAALLKIACQLTFFKDSHLWGRKLKRIQKKLTKYPQTHSKLTGTILK